MEEKKDTNSEEPIEEMFSKMGNYMLNKLKAKIESVKKRLKDVEGSEKTNKEEISGKLNELIQVMNIMVDKTELQNKTQAEMIDLMENMGKLNNEIDDLLLE